MKTIALILALVTLTLVPSVSMAQDVPAHADESSDAASIEALEAEIAELKGEISLLRELVMRTMYENEYNDKELRRQTDRLDYFLFRTRLSLGMVMPANDYEATAEIARSLSLRIWVMSPWDFGEYVYSPGIHESLSYINDGAKTEDFRNGLWTANDAERFASCAELRLERQDAFDLMWKITHNEVGIEDGNITDPRLRIQHELQVQLDRFADTHEAYSLCLKHVQKSTDPSQKE